MNLLSLLPAELQWEIYFQCWKLCIGAVHHSIQNEVPLATRRGAYLERSLGKWRRPEIKRRWCWPLWGQWHGGKARHLVGSDSVILLRHHNTFCACMDSLHCHDVDGFRYRTINYYIPISYYIPRMQEGGIAKYDQMPACQKLSEDETRRWAYPFFSN